MTKAGKTAADEATALAGGGGDVQSLAEERDELKAKNEALEDQLAAQGASIRRLQELSELLQAELARLEDQPPKKAPAHPPIMPVAAPGHAPPAHAPEGSTGSNHSPKRIMNDCSRGNIQCNLNHGSQVDNCPQLCDQSHHHYTCVNPAGYMVAEGGAKVYKGSCKQTQVEDQHQEAEMPIQRRPAPAAGGGGHTEGPMKPVPPPAMTH